MSSKPSSRVAGRPSRLQVPRPVWNRRRDEFFGRRLETTSCSRRHCRQPARRSVREDRDREDIAHQRWRPARLHDAATRRSTSVSETRIRLVSARRTVLRDLAPGKLPYVRNVPGASATARAAAQTARSRLLRSVRGVLPIHRCEDNPGVADAFVDAIGELLRKLRLGDPCGLLNA